jgi:hypothetical protein
MSEVTDLTKDDRHSSAAIKLRQAYEARLKGLRVQNDARMDESARSEHLGRIAEVKMLLETLGEHP